MKVASLLLLVFLSALVSPQAESISFRQSLQTLSNGQTARTDSVAYTLNGGRLIALAGNTITVWLRNSANSYDRSQSLTTTDSLSNADISPDGQKIAAAGTGNSVHVWRLSNTTRQYEYSERLVNSADATTQNVRAVTFNRAGDKLIAGSSDTTINVWALNPVTDRFAFRQKLTGHTAPVVDVSAGATRIASAGSTDSSIRIWSYNAGLDSYTLLQIINVPGASSVLVSQLSADEGVMVAGLQNGNAVVYNRQSTNGNYQSQQTLTANNGGVTAAAVANDGSKIATAGVDNTTAYWIRSASTNNQGNFTLRNRLNDAAASVAFDRRNQLAVGLLSSTNGQVRVYSLNTDCGQVPNSNNASFNGVDCGCLNGFVWYDGGCQVLNCTRIPYSFGALAGSTTSCLCQTGFNFQNGQCVRDCTTFANSLGITDGVDVCLCLPGFEWNGLLCGVSPLVTTGSITTTTTTTTTGGTTTVVTDNGAPLNCSTIPNSLGVSIGPNQCFCRAGFYFQNRQCIRNCSAIVNSNGVNPTIDSCGCNPGYSWNGLGCVLPTTGTGTTTTTTGTGGVVIVTNTTSVSTVTTVDCTNVPNSLGLNNGPDACRCVDGFYWNRVACFRNCTNVPSSTGQTLGIDGCQCLTGLAWNGQQCIGSTVIITNITNVTTVVCNSVANSNGVNNGTNACFCNPGFYWFLNTCARNCSQVPNSTGAVSAFGSGCVCFAGFTWNGTACSSPMLIITNITTLPTVNCTDIPNSVGYGSSPGICLCSIGFYWANGVCERNCSLVPNSNMLNNGSSACFCNFGYYWSGRECSRNILNCNTLPNSISYDPNNPNACLCSSGYFWRISACYRDCSFITGSTGGNDRPDACQCLTGLVWNGRICANSTTVDCRTLPNSLGVGATPDVCLCAATFYWESPYCYRNCSLVTSSTGIPLRNIGPNVCDCPIGRYWNNFTCAQCQTQPNTRPSALSNRCDCIAGFTWISSTSVCTRNCVGMLNSNGTNLNAQACNCNPSYIWNGTNCSLGINCSAIGYTSGSNPSNPLTCNCQSGFAWSSQNRRCQQDCTTVPNSQGNAADGSCTCEASFDYSNGACVPNCGRMNYTTGEIKNGECKCNKNYRWDKNTRYCIASSSSNAGLRLGLGLGLGIPLGLLALAGLGLLGYYCCCGPSVAAAAPMVSTATMLPSVANFATPGVAAAPLLVSGPPVAAAVLPSAGMSRMVGPPIVGGTTTTTGRTTLLAQPSTIIPGGRVGQTVTTTYMGGAGGVGGGNAYFLEGASSGGTAYMMDGVGVTNAMGMGMQTGSMRAIETIPVTTTVMDGISTTTAVPHYTVKDNLTGAHSYLNYPFGADEV